MLNKNTKGREAIALVKDAIEFCDKVPIVYDDQRVKDKSSNTNNKTQRIEKTAENNSQQQQQDQEQLVESNTLDNISIETNMNVVRSTQTTLEASNTTGSEYLPQFTELQKKQLDEQLRNVCNLYSYFFLQSKTVLNSFLFCYDYLSTFNYLHKHV